MYKQYFCSRPYALHAWLLGGAILVLLTGAALCQFFSNYWKGDFYAELERTIRDSTHNSTKKQALQCRMERVRGDAERAGTVERFFG